MMRIKTTFTAVLAAAATTFTVAAPPADSQPSAATAATPAGTLFTITVMDPEYRKAHAGQEVPALVAFDAQGHEIARVARFAGGDDLAELVNAAYCRVGPYCDAGF